MKIFVNDHGFDDLALKFLASKEENKLFIATSDFALDRMIELSVSSGKSWMPPSWRIAQMDLFLEHHLDDKIVEELYMEDLHGDFPEMWRDGVIHTMPQALMVYDMHRQNNEN